MRRRRPPSISPAAAVQRLWLEGRLAPGLRALTASARRPFAPHHTGLFQHCALPPPADLPSLGWAGQARWSISNRYYDAEVAFVLRQVLDEDGSAALASDESEAQEEEDEDEEDAEDGYPAVLVLLSTAALAQVRPVPDL